MALADIMDRITGLEEITKAFGEDGLVIYDRQDSEIGVILSDSAAGALADFRDWNVGLTGALADMPVWVEANPAYRQGIPAYEQENPAYRQENSAHGQENSAHGPETSADGQENPTYRQETPAYRQETPAYGQETPTHGQDTVNSLAALSFSILARPEKGQGFGKAGGVQDAEGSRETGISGEKLDALSERVSVLEKRIAGLDQVDGNLRIDGNLM